MRRRSASTRSRTRAALALALPLGFVLAAAGPAVAQTDPSSPTTTIPPDPSQQNGLYGLDPTTIVVGVIATLIGIALLLTVLTWRFWRNTKPVDPSLHGLVELGRRRRRRRRAAAPVPVGGGPAVAGAGAGAAARAGGRGDPPALTGLEALSARVPAAVPARAAAGRRVGAADERPAVEPSSHSQPVSVAGRSAVRRVHAAPRRPAR